MNQLYYGDNLDILRHYIADESVDLIYIDPPFNSNQAYNVIFSEADGSSSQAQIQAFEDTWRWGEATEQAYHDLVVNAPHQLVEIIKNFRGFLTETNLMAYLVMMALRLVFLHRALKPTGSFYLHCDPTASHYLKIILDQVFGVENFKNEIIWKRATSGSSKSVAVRFGSDHDVILFYTRGRNYTFNQIYLEYPPSEIKKRFRRSDERGRYKDAELATYSEETLERLRRENKLIVTPGGKYRYKIYLDEIKGVLADDIWTDIPPINSMAKERLGYPTQKPEALLERIIRASSNEGDTVLDAFAGCGTTIAVAQRLNRRWIGIDITHLAIALLKYRLQGAFGDEVKYEIIGEPKDEASARALAAQNRYQFQWWALSLIKARPYQEKKKGADEGIDGVIYFLDIDPKTRKELTQKIIVQVKSGRVSVKDIRELKTVVDNQNAVIGVFITLEPPSKPMITEAVAAGIYQRFSAKYPKIQIRTIKELLEGHGVKYPQTNVDLTFKKATRQSKSDEQLELL